MNYFAQSLAMSHAAEDLPLWREVYSEAFPTMVAMPSHREDGDHQRQGIDRSIVLANGHVFRVDEKVRGRNRKTGRVYQDIALEFVADQQRGTLGWVCKPILADYIAYAIAPLGMCYLLPVPQLQAVWFQHGACWRKKFQVIEAQNRHQGRSWVTLSCCVPPAVIYPAIGRRLRVKFTPTEVAHEVKFTPTEVAHEW